MTCGTTTGAVERVEQMARWSVSICLCRDLADAVYDPADPPYVSHDRGTKLVVEYIEKHWCPSIESEDLIRASTNS